MNLRTKELSYVWRWFGLLVTLVQEDNSWLVTVLVVEQDEKGNRVYIGFRVR